MQVIDLVENLDTMYVFQIPLLAIFLHFSSNAVKAEIFAFGIKNWKIIEPANANAITITSISQKTDPIQSRK
jgi:hypothetical protein